MFQILEHQRSGPLRECEAVPLRVEGSTRLLGLIVTPREHLQPVESRQGEGDYGSLTASRDHRPCVPPFYDFICFPQGMAPGCTGGNNAEIGAPNAQLDGRISGCHVADHHGSCERIHTPWAAVVEGLIALIDRGQSSYRRADQHPDIVRIVIVDLQARLPHGLPDGHHGELDIRVQSLGFLGIHMITGIELVDLGRDLSPISRRIEASQRSNSRLAGQQAIPGCGDIQPQRADRTQPRHYHPIRPVSEHANKSSSHKLNMLTPSDREVVFSQFQ